MHHYLGGRVSDACKTTDKLAMSSELMTTIKQDMKTRAKLLK